jgi:hypothetical protein
MGISWAVKYLLDARLDSIARGDTSGVLVMPEFTRGELLTLPSLLVLPDGLLVCLGYYITFEEI